MDGDVGWIQRHILVRLTARDVRMAISDGERIGMTRPAIKVTRIVRYVCTWVDLRKTILNLAIALQNEYNEKYVAILIVYFVKEITSSDVLTDMSAPYYYWYTLEAKKMLRHKSVPALIGRLNGDASRSRNLGSSHMDEI